MDRRDERSRWLPAPPDVGRARAAWVGLLALVAVWQVHLAFAFPTQSFMASPWPIDSGLAKAWVVAILAGALALVWTHPRAIATRSASSRVFRWYQASWILAAVVSLAGLMAAFNHEQRGVALPFQIASVALLAFMYPRARAFRDDDPPLPLPLEDGAAEEGRLRCPHCGARTFAIAARIWGYERLSACRKCGAWVSVSPWPNALALPLMMLATLGWKAAADGGGFLAVGLVALGMLGIVVACVCWAPLVTRYPPPRA